ncbi:MAG TPA: VOC family protein [Candidatus Manganitrophaceae bacterium]|nr:VOC family protein [Candidatus Manganitrophaceae bacterium]
MSPHRMGHCMGRFQIHHIAIQTADLERSLRFYEKILGLTRIKEERSPKGRRIVWLDSGSGRIELYSGKPGQPLASGWNSNTVGPLSIGFWVSDLEEAVRELDKKKAPVIKRPYEPVPGERAAMIQGPDGEEIVLLEKKVGL